MQPQHNTAQYNTIQYDTTGEPAGGDCLIKKESTNPLGKPNVGKS